ncbi:MAG: UbiA family prenyltransferase [Actinomycetota bacterium]|nr:UbiA family prenyltransferase [Actinomycetota bacterium]
MTTGALTRPEPRRLGLPAWLRMWRPHFIPFSLGAGLVGLFAAADDPTVLSVALGMSVCVTGYGVGVLTNDYVDREADAINAPDRPFVTGEVSPERTMAFIAVLCVTTLALSIAFAPSVAIWSAIALGGHLLYELTKPIPMLGNVVNGFDIAVFTLVGAAAGAPGAAWHDAPQAVWLYALLIGIVMSGFCLVGYFKDVPGDRAAGYRTLPVFLGPDRARWFAPPFPLVAVAAVLALAIADPGALGSDGANAAFGALLGVAVAAYAVAMRFLFRAPEGHAYEALVWYTRGSAIFVLALGALVEPLLFLAIAAPMVALMEVALLETKGSGQA